MKQKIIFIYSLTLILLCTQILAAQNKTIQENTDGSVSFARITRQDALEAGYSAGWYSTQKKKGNSMSPFWTESRIKKEAIKNLSATYEAFKEDYIRGFINGFKDREHGRKYNPN